MCFLNFLFECFQLTKRINVFQLAKWIFGVGFCRFYNVADGHSNTGICFYVTDARRMDVPPAHVPGVKAEPHNRK
jgi:hypothetical protein